MKFVLYHMIAFLAGFVIDLCVGDPYWLPHPIRWIGSLIQQLEKWLYRKQSAFARGFILVILIAQIQKKDTYQGIVKIPVVIMH